MITIHNALVHATLEEIDEKDQAYYVPSFRDVKKLLASIEQIGLLNPPILQQKENGQFRIVCGFQRVLALKHLGMPALDARLIDSALSSEQVFLYALLDNLSLRPFNPVEISHIIQRLKEFGLNREMIIETYLPKLGYGSNPKIFELYQGIATLAPEWQKAIIDDRVPLDLIPTILTFDASDSLALIGFFDLLHLGKNRQREFLQLLSDVARINNVTISQLIGEQWIATITDKMNWTHAQKAEHLKTLLLEKRYPRYAAVRKQFEDLIKESQLPRGFELRHSPHFETNEFSMNIHFSSSPELRKKLDHIEMLVKKGYIQKLIELI